MAITRQLTLAEVTNAFDNALLQAFTEGRNEDNPFEFKNPYVMKLFVDNIQLTVLNNDQ